MIPNLKILKTSNIDQEKIFQTLQNICIEATDALVLLSADELGKQVNPIELVTDDNRLLIRGSQLVKTSHPSKYLQKCPTSCPNKCRHFK
jgi:hypothetical protein